MTDEKKPSMEEIEPGYWWVRKLQEDYFNQWSNSTSASYPPDESDPKGVTNTVRLPRLVPRGKPFIVEVQRVTTEARVAKTTSLDIRNTEGRRFPWARLQFLRPVESAPEVDDE